MQTRQTKYCAFQSYVAVATDVFSVYLFLDTNTCVCCVVTALCFHIQCESLSGYIYIYVL